jgi:hypothetical protein
VISGAKYELPKSLRDTSHFDELGYNDSDSSSDDSDADSKDEKDASLNKDKEEEKTQFKFNIGNTCYQRR